MKKKIILAAALIIAGVLAFWIFHKPANGPGNFKRGSGAEGRPMPVQAAIATSGDIDVYIDALGTVTARNTATVKTRVNGLLQRIYFRDGQKVKEGELLAQIDPRPFQV
ncbi:MAG: biotin/lipoyl-binding protein, partial [Gallionella sp.]